MSYLARHRHASSLHFLRRALTEDFLCVRSVRVAFPSIIPFQSRAERRRKPWCRKAFFSKCCQSLGVTPQSSELEFSANELRIFWSEADYLSKPHFSLTWKLVWNDVGFKVGLGNMPDRGLKEMAVQCLLSLFACFVGELIARIH